MKIRIPISKFSTLCLAGAALAAGSGVLATAQTSSRNHTLTGVVMEDIAGNVFLMRTGEGYTFRVFSQYGEPPRLSNRDTVRVYGKWQDGVFQATNVRILDQDVYHQSDRDRKRMATGIVTYMMEGGFEMRMPNGRLMQVWSRYGGLPPSLSLADRVRAYGYVEGFLMRAGNIRVLRQGTIDDS